MRTALNSIWRKTRRFIIHKVLHADDTPNRIALGFAIGIFIGITPTVGFQMIIAGAIAVALRANKAVAIPVVWITNPITIWPIYAGCFSVGNALVGSDAVPNERFARLAQLQSLVANGYARFFELAFWQELAIGIARLGLELWLGCLIVATICALISFFVVRAVVTAYRKRHQMRRDERSKRRTGRRFGKRVSARGSVL